MTFSCSARYDIDVILDANVCIRDVLGFGCLRKLGVRSEPFRRKSTNIRWYVSVIRHTELSVASSVSVRFSEPSRSSHHPPSDTTIVSHQTLPSIIIVFITCSLRIVHILRCFRVCARSDSGRCVTLVPYLHDIPG